MPFLAQSVVCLPKVAENGPVPFLAQSVVCKWLSGDRFHWRGHVGCSKGYCLDMYNSVDVKAINSQVNEQANAGLQRIRGQLAYMTPSNFILNLSLFLACAIMTKLER